MPHRNPQARRIILTAAEFYGLPPDAITGASRDHEVCKARHVAAFLARRMAAIPWADLEEEFNRDRTTLLYGWRRISRAIDTDRHLAAEVAGIWGHVRRSEALTQRGEVLT